MTPSYAPPTHRKVLSSPRTWLTKRPNTSLTLFLLAGDPALDYGRALDPQVDLGGLLNATFGNAAELIIALLILSHEPEMYPLVKATITGSIIGNALLVLGMAILFGGLSHSRQVFNRTAASMGATLLALASVGLIMPTVYYYLFRAGATLSTQELHNVEYLSEEIAGVL